MPLKPAEIHTQVAVKVNAFVDEGIARLVEALGLFQEIQTIESCEGSSEHRAYVYFVHCGEVDEFAQFIHKLSVQLGARQPACCEYVLVLEWMAGTEIPIAKLELEKSYVEGLATTIRKIASIRHTIS